MSSNGVYGTRVGSLVNESDIDIFYSFSPTRDSLDTNLSFKRLDSKLLSQTHFNENEEEEGVNEVIEGLYNLKLPFNVFYQKGFYTIYIKPKEMKTIITEVGVLSEYPDIKGVVLDTSTINDTYLKNLLFTNNSLIGYRIIYYDENNNRENYYRLITSNNRCEAVVATNNTRRYRYNDNGTLIFLTVTPSLATTYKPNALPYIGSSTQRIAIVNTKFEPVMLEIEMVEHDIETVSTMLEGSQLRNMENGLITTFNDNGDIYHQSEVYSLKDEYTKQPMYEVKKNKKNEPKGIDFSQRINDV